MTSSGRHASEQENGDGDRAARAADHAEGTGRTTADGTGAPPPSGWLPTLSVHARGPRWVLWGGAGAVALVLAVAGVVMATRLPPDTTLAGAEVASADAAPAALDQAAAALGDLQIAFTSPAGGRAVVSGADLGLQVDEAASTAPLQDGLPALGSWISRPFGGPQANPVEVRPVAPEVLADVAARASTPPVSADVEVTPTGVEVTPGSDGLQVEPGEVAAALDAALAQVATTPPAAWPAEVEAPVEGTPEPPPVAQADIDHVIAEIDRVEQGEVTIRGTVPAPAEEGGGTAVTDEREVRTIRLRSSELRNLVAVEPDPDAPPGQRLVLVPDTDDPPQRIEDLLEMARISPVLRASIEDRSPTPTSGGDEVLTDVSDITGTIVPGETISPGFEPDAEATLAAVIEAALAGGGEVDVVGGPLPTPTPADMGIVEPVSTFTSFFPAGQSRVQNIHRIAEIVDGTVIPAGETYELNHAVGRRTTDNGFTLGGAILDGELVSDVGGGVSQFATTFFNAAWFAGVELVDWKPHSFYFDRYPAGREATINYPNVNLEIRNDTPYAILVDTHHTPSSVTVTFWSTPYWDVETISGPCGCGGSFTITVDRVRTPPDGEPIRESWTTTYTVPTSG